MWYPIKLSYHVRTYSFGERLIPEKLGKTAAPEGVVAETWEISDYKDTTGMVLNGEFAGKTLHEVTLEHPEALVGQGWSGPHFPLLCKFLDASHMLPVHLHADNETAISKYKEPNGKTEAWHIIWAAEGASILAGLKKDYSEDELFDAFKAEDYDRVMPRMEIISGDTVYVPAGVIHAFGPDTLIFEVQQTSDLGKTVMPGDLYGNRYSEADWDANIRETLSELRTHYKPKPNSGLSFEDGVAQKRMCCAGPHFALERWSFSETYSYSVPETACRVLSNLGDTLNIHYAGGVETLARAESCILPAALGEIRLEPKTTADLLVSYVPDLEQDVRTPLRKAGFADPVIAQLGDL
ncbi:MAG: hypothetical protein KC422_07620 [Trueperaceae bacterium]|nr:hypothetical protein [Trueperaceae bacterium]